MSSKPEGTPRREGVPKEELPHLLSSPGFCELRTELLRDWTGPSEEAIDVAKRLHEV